MFLFYAIVFLIGSLLVYKQVKDTRYQYDRLLSKRGTRGQELLKKIQNEERIGIVLALLAGMFASLFIVEVVVEFLTFLSLI